MYVHDSFTLAETGSLDTLTTYLSSGQSIAIDGQMDTNKVDGQMYLNAQGRIQMKNEDPITSQQLYVIANSGIFLRTDVESLTVMAAGKSLKNTLRWMNTTTWWSLALG